MQVEIVGFDQISYSHMVVLSDMDQNALLPLVIGEAEATSITLALDGIELPRPLTHDLMVNLIKTLGAKVVYVEITDLIEDIFYAHVKLETANKTYSVDCRPSDAIALALRVDVPIYLSDKVAELCIDVQPGKDQELEDFRSFLDNITPDDFRKRSE